MHDLSSKSSAILKHLSLVLRSPLAWTIGYTATLPAVLLRWSVSRRFTKTCWDTDVQKVQFVSVFVQMRLWGLCVSDKTTGHLKPRLWWQNRSLVTGFFSGMKMKPMRRTDNCTVLPPSFLGRAHSKLSRSSAWIQKQKLKKSTDDKKERRNYYITDFNTRGRS